MCSLCRQEKNNSFFPSKSGSIASVQSLNRPKSWSTCADSTTCRQMRNTVVSYQQLVLPCTIINAATSLPDFTAKELMEALYIASKRNTMHKPNTLFLLSSQERSVCGNLWLCNYYAHISPVDISVHFFKK